MSYRYYRLKRANNRRGGKKFRRIRGFIKRLEHSFKESEFDGTDPGMMFYFLTGYAEEADLLEMTEGQDYLTMGYFIKENARRDFKAARHGGKSTSGVTKWPEAVYWLLKTYAQPNTIRDTVLEFRGTKQKPEEMEVTYASRLRKPAKRCRNVSSESELMNVFIDGLDPRIRSAAATFRESHDRGQVNLDSVISFARDEGDTLRARFHRNHRESWTSSSSRGGSVFSKPSKVHFVEEDDAEYARELSISASHDMVGLIHDGSSIPTSDFPSTAKTDEADAEMWGEPKRGLRQVRPQLLAYQDRATEAGRP